MTEEAKRWFCEKVMQNPEYLYDVYLPAVDKIVSKAENALREAIRSKPIDDIRYQMGLLDGTQKIAAVIDGLKLSEKRPDRPGLMARIFSGESETTPESG